MTQTYLELRFHVKLYYVDIQCCIQKLKKIMWFQGNHGKVLCIFPYNLHSFDFPPCEGFAIDERVKLPTFKFDIEDPTTYILSVVFNLLGKEVISYVKKSMSHWATIIVTQ